jgi:KDO2-lipid IV(A) lauroyltransferase
VHASRHHLRQRLRRSLRIARWRTQQRVSKAAGRFAIVALRSIRRRDVDRLADFAARTARRIGPWLSEHRVGRANLAAAYPEKSPAEIEAILGGVWDNLGRLGAEYAHLDRLWDFDPEKPEASGRVEFSPDSVERFMQLRDDGKPALIFAAHLGNWELPALAAAAHGLDAAALYRTPNSAEVAEAIRDIRSGSMGRLIPNGPGASHVLAAVLERGTHVGMLVDQHLGSGIDVVFFGRRCKANPLIARLARLFECPIHGTRVIRLPDHRFRVELTDALEPVRAADGTIDIAGTMQAITSVVEGWVREYPEQWLWVHRRWR